MATTRPSADQPPLTVTIVGAGTVGTALGANLIVRGHHVRYAVRDEGTSVPDGAAAIHIDGCAPGSDLTILAVPFDAVAQVVPRLGLASGDVLIDATNPFGVPIPESYPSGAAFVQHLAGDGVHVVKTFGVLGAEHMANPALPDGSAPIPPVAADDDATRDRVVTLARHMGFDAVGAGALRNAATLENAALYWGLLASTAGLGRDMALVAHHRSQRAIRSASNRE